MSYPIKVYQINMDRDVCNSKFVSFDFLKGGVDDGSYDLVFDGEVPDNDLENIFLLLNTSLPDGFRGHSLSVSDVVVTEDGAFYCDSFGFKKLDDFQP